MWWVELFLLLDIQDPCCQTVHSRTTCNKHREKIIADASGANHDMMVSSGFCAHMVVSGGLHVLTWWYLVGYMCSHGGVWWVTCAHMVVFGRLQRGVIPIPPA